MTRMENILHIYCVKITGKEKHQNIGCDCLSWQEFIKRIKKKNPNFLYARTLFK